MKRSILILAALAIVTIFMPRQVVAQTSAPKIAFVDIRRVMMESERGKEARKSLTDEIDKRKKEMNQRQDELQKLKDALEKQSATITPEALAAKQKDYQDKLKDYQRIANDYQTDLQQKDQELTQAILKDLQGIVKSIGDADKYTLILERSQAAILFASSAIDITDKVIAEYNQTAKKAPAAKK